MSDPDARKIQASWPVTAVVALCTAAGGGGLGSALTGRDVAVQVERMNGKLDLANEQLRQVVEQGKDQEDRLRAAEAEQADLRNRAATLERRVDALERGGR